MVHVTQDSPLASGIKLFPHAVQVVTPVPDTEQAVQSVIMFPQVSHDSLSEAGY